MGLCKQKKTQYYATKQEGINSAKGSICFSSLPSCSSSANASKIIRIRSSKQRRPQIPQNPPGNHFSEHPNRRTRAYGGGHVYPTTARHRQWRRSSLLEATPADLWTCCLYSPNSRRGWPARYHRSLFLADRARSPTTIQRDDSLLRDFAFANRALWRFLFWGFR